MSALFLISFALLFTALSGFATQPLVIKSNGNVGMTPVGFQPNAILEVKGVFPPIPRNYGMSEIPKGGQRQRELSKARVAAPRRSAAIPAPSFNVLLITWPTNVGIVVIESSTDLISWQRIATNSTGTLTVTNDPRLATLIAPYMTRSNAKNMDSKMVSGRRLYYGGGSTWYRGRMPDFSKATVSWDRSTSLGVKGYNLYIGTKSRTYTNKVDTLHETSRTITLGPPATYYFAATAYDILGTESDWSNEVSYTVPLTSPFKLSIRKL